MRAVVIYDSVSGNTEQIARVVASAMPDAAHLSRADAVDLSRLGDIDLLIVGSPTQGGRATATIQKFLKLIPDGSLKAVKVAAFDTRISSDALPLRLLMRVIGFAASKIAKGLQAKGGSLVVAPEGFVVTGTKGPLKDGEIARATAWAKGLLQKAG
jgi:flavodoxin